MGQLLFFLQIQTEKNIFPLFLPCHLTAIKWSYFSSTKIDFDRRALIWRFDYYYGFCHGCFFEVEDQYGATNGRNEWSHTILWHLFVLFYTRNPLVRYSSHQINWHCLCIKIQFISPYTNRSLLWIIIFNLLMFYEQCDYFPSMFWPWVTVQRLYKYLTDCTVPKINLESCNWHIILPY